jgi:hypothetical protein
MQLKIHKTYRDVVSLCDSNLLGKKFEQKNSQLNLKESFYKGEEVDEKKAKQIIQDLSNEDATFNIVGEESIQLALECQIISEQGIKKIQDIPFALVLM